MPPPARLRWRILRKVRGAASIRPSRRAGAATGSSSYQSTLPQAGWSWKNSTRVDAGPNLVSKHHSLSPSTKFRSDDAIYCRCCCVRARCKPSVCTISSPGRVRRTCGERRIPHRHTDQVPGHKSPRSNGAVERPRSFGQAMPRRDPAGGGHDEGNAEVFFCVFTHASDTFDTRQSRYRMNLTRASSGSFLTAQFEGPLLGGRLRPLE